MLASFSLCCALIAAGRSGQTELHQDLRNKEYLQPGIYLTGPSPSKYTMQEPEGLRVTLPAKRQPRSPVGLQTDIEVAGDFDVIGAYELLAADRPAEGAPKDAMVGVNLFLVQGKDNKRFAKIGRYNSGLWGHVYLCQVTLRGRTPDTMKESFPTAETSGELRASRRGSTITFFVKDASTGGQFKELMKDDFGTADVTTVRFLANTGNEPCAVDARLIDFRMSHHPPVAEEAARPRTQLWVVLGMLAFAAVIAGALLFRRARRRRNSTKAAPAMARPALANRQR